MTQPVTPKLIVTFDDRSRKWKISQISTILEMAEISTYEPTDREL
jgi:hypothetical protein